MSAIGAGLALACVVSKAGGPENNETQISTIMTISKQISTSFSMMSSLAAVPKSPGSDVRPCPFVCGRRDKVHEAKNSSISRILALGRGLNESL
jgi:hypothetical protein